MPHVLSMHNVVVGLREGGILQNSKSNYSRSALFWKKGHIILLYKWMYKKMFHILQFQKFYLLNQYIILTIEILYNKTKRGGTFAFKKC